MYDRASPKAPALPGTIGEDREVLAPQPISIESSFMSELRALHDASRKHLDEAISSVSAEMDAFRGLEADLGQWIDVLEDRAEAGQYRSAHRDLGMALFACMSGLYGQAFSALRSFIEVSVANIRWSASELDRRQWIAGYKDISWSTVTSTDDGLYSTTYVRAFCPAALDERDEMLALIKETYRKCSGYVHGEIASSSLLPPGIAHSPAVLHDWMRSAVGALQVVHHCLFVRYWEDLNSDQREALEPCLEQHLSHFLSVRTALELPIEER